MNKITKNLASNNLRQNPYKNLDANPLQDFGLNFSGYGKNRKSIGRNLNGFVQIIKTFYQHRKRI